MNKRYLALFGLLASLTLLAARLVHRDEKNPPPKPVVRTMVEITGDLFTNRAVPHLRLEIPPDGVATLRRYRWEWGSHSEGRTNVLATLREGTRVYTNVAVHLKGAAGSFRPVDDKPAWTLNFEKFAPGQRFHGLTKIHLNNSVQDPSYVSEQICREMFLAAGVPTPRAAHATVALNGRDLGLYVLIEGWNKQFLKRYFKNTKGNLYDSGFAQEITQPLEVNSGEHPEDRSDLKALVEAAEEPDLTNRLVRLSRVLDVDRFLTFTALEVMLLHWDGYSMNKNNYRVFHDLETDRLVFMPHGLDQMFGVRRANPTNTITPQMRGLVARALLQVPEGRRRYLDRMSQLLTNVFRAEILTTRVNEVAAQVRPALAQGISGAINYEWAVTALRSRITDRASSMRDQLAKLNTPLEFDSSGVAKLTRWDAKRDYGSPSFSRQNERLEITASGDRSYGTWRSTVLLEAGEYQFVGRLKTDGVEWDEDVTRGGVALRISGDRSPLTLPAAPDWTTITYNLSVQGLTDVELICELRASKGHVWFDAESLKLIRSQSRPPARESVTRSRPAIQSEAK
jgi:hypothetical protein